MGLTNLGIVHTLIGLAALFTAFYLLAMHREIPGRSLPGKFYFWSTALTAITGLFIFQHGGFGAPHVLSILTLVALTMAWVAVNTRFYGRASRYFEVTAYTSTVLFHMIPGFTETLTRVPVGQPLATSPESPILQAIFAVLFVVYLIGLGLQLKRVHSAPVPVEDDEISHA